jgi:putative tricarboxylic transport membrane protein
MWKSAELPIGYHLRPGAGRRRLAVLAVGDHAVCCGMIAFNWWRRTSPPSQSEEPFLDAYGWRMVLSWAAA